MQRIAALVTPVEHERRRARARFGTLALIALGFLAVQPTIAESPASSELAARGRYLVTIGVCNDCHTPLTMGANGPEPDMARMLSGHPQELEMPTPPALGSGPWAWVGAATNTAFAGPWGTSYAPNLTPDENTGIGIWTKDIFISTLRGGRHWGVARPILPPMPWQNYREMSDEDLDAVWTYLRSIPPVHNRVPDSQPASEAAPTTATP
jgi:mono/diheme cytochrome c family protein